MPNIKFSSDYPKLWGQTSAKLLAVETININRDTPAELLEYDTKKKDGTYYPLKSGKYLQLVFIGNKHIPFCTIRSAYPPQKEEYYRSLIGQNFDVVIENKE